MPVTTPEGDIVATVKTGDGKRTIVLLRSVPHKSKGKKRADGMPVGGRNALELTDDGAEWIASEMATGADVDDLAGELCVEIATLYNSRNGTKMKRAVKEGTNRCNNRLRKAQVSAALNGNATMLVWLGKNRLGQSDSPRSEGNPALTAFAEDMVKAARRLDADTDTEGWEE